MSSVAELVTDLLRRGARLQVIDGRLRLEAPRGLVTPETWGLILAHKPEVLALLDAQRAEYERRRQAYREASEALDALEDELRQAQAAGLDTSLLEARYQEAWEAWQQAARAFDEARSWPVAAEIRREVDAEVADDAEAPPGWRERCEAMTMAQARGWPMVSIGWAEVGGDPGAWAGFLFHGSVRDVRRALAVLRGEAPGSGARAPDGHVPEVWRAGARGLRALAAVPGLRGRSRVNTTEALVFCPPGHKVCGAPLPNGRTCTRWVKSGYERCYRCRQRLHRDEGAWDDDEEGDRATP